MVYVLLTCYMISYAFLKHPYTNCSITFKTKQVTMATEITLLLLISTITCNRHSTHTVQSSKVKHPIYLTTSTKYVFIMQYTYILFLIPDPFFIGMGRNYTSEALFKKKNLNKEIYSFYVQLTKGSMSKQILFPFKLSFLILRSESEELRTCTIYCKTSQ